jgi:hypothetical protein
MDINSEEYKNIVRSLLRKDIEFIPKEKNIPKNIPKTECVAVGELRKGYGNDIDLEKWMKIEKNLYVGRKGRIFINKEIFHYPGSKWGNPYKISEYSLEDSLRLYEEHVRNNPELIKTLKELEGKTLGCFCKQSGPCHAKILAKLFQEFI